MKKKRPSPSAITRPFGVVGVLEILRHRQPDDGLGHRRAGGGVHHLADDHPGARAGRGAIGGEDLRGTPNRQGEHDDDRRDPTCLSHSEGHNKYAVNIPWREMLARGTV